MRDTGAERHKAKWYLLTLWIFVMAASPALARTVICPATKDVWISTQGREVNHSMGKTPRLKIKLWQEFALVDFDVRQVEGYDILGAELYVNCIPGRIDPSWGCDLRWLTVSTITSPWEEGRQSKPYRTDQRGYGATFLEASYRQRPWAWAGSKAYHVMLGNGNSIRDDQRLEKVGHGWYKVTLQPALVKALVDGVSDGLAIQDGSGDVQHNPYIYAREQRGKGPYLKVRLGAKDIKRPHAPSIDGAGPAPNDASVTQGAIYLTVTPPADAFAYHITVNDRPYPQYNVARPQATPQTLILQDLLARADITIGVSVSDGAGNRSSEASIDVTVSPPITVPKLPQPPWQPKGGQVPVVDGKMRVWAIPELVKTNPTTGHVRLESGDSDYAEKNAVFDGADSHIRLASARGEMVSFQLVIERVADALEGIILKVSELKRGTQVLSNQGVRMFRMWYGVAKSGDAWEAEYAIPIQGPLSIPALDNQIPEHQTQQVTIDIHVPSDTEPGTYRGAVTVAARGVAAYAMPLTLRIYPAVIPERLNFNPELNCYRGPARAGTTAWFDWHRLAHYHRSSLNRVPYGHNGHTHDDLAPMVNPAGHVIDWSTYDKAVGPLVDGSAFTDNPRAGVPVRTLYLPLYEGFPLNFRHHYNAGHGMPLPTGRAKSKTDLRHRQKLKTYHDLHAKPIEAAFDPAYRDALVTCARDFVAHYQANEWFHTTMQMYLNNKPKYGFTLWMLDEPVEYLDWATLRYFSQAFHDGIQGAGRDDWFVFRGDISRPHWQGNLLDGLMEYLYVNGEMFDMPRLVRDTTRRMPTTLYVYGSTNDPRHTNYGSVAWCYTAYFLGADGVLPWQSIGSRAALKQPTITALLVDGSPFGHTAIASLRVHALRRGAQDVELMRLLRQQRGWSRRHLERLITQAMPLQATFRQAFQDEAAAVTFNSVLSSTTFVQVKEGLLMLLDDADGQ